MLRLPRWLLVCAAFACLGGGLYTLHFFLGRPDRILNQVRHVQLLDVKSELLHYEAEHGKLPDALADLAPNYLRAEDLAGPNGPLYKYDPAQRIVGQMEGTLIRGLYSRRCKPEKIILPPAPLKVAVTPPPQQLAKDPPDVHPGTENSMELPKPEEPPMLMKLPLPPEISKTDPPATTQPSEPEPTKVASREEPAPLKPLVLQGPALSDPPAGAYVFEAEHFSESNFGWEAHADPNSGGGAYFHCKEGIANNSAMITHGVGNFYDVHSRPLISDLRYHFHLPKGGTYYCYARMWTTDTHCSNHLCCDFDNTSSAGSLDNRTPFRWLWTPISGGAAHGENEQEARYLAAGDHFIHIYIWEDGIQLDQFIFSPTPVQSSAGPFKTNFEPNHGTAFEKANGPAFNLSVDLKHALISPASAPEAKVVIRRVRPAGGNARLKVMLKYAGAEGSDLQVADTTIDLGALPELSFYPLSFPGLDLEKIPRREFLLTVELAKEGKPLSTFSVVLAKTFAWEVFGPGKYWSQDMSGPLDGQSEPKAGEKRKWELLKDSDYDWFGVLDFGVHYGGSSKHAPQFQTTYAQTKVRVKAAGEYLIKVMADDQMRLWIDGQDVFRIDDVLPVTRSGRSFKQHLDAGEHRIRMRINQSEGPWQAFLRIRTEDDDIADVEGKAP
jgi:hypothetical protein